MEPNIVHARPTVQWRGELVEISIVSDGVNRLWVKVNGPGGKSAFNISLTELQQLTTCCEAVCAS